MVSEQPEVSMQYDDTNIKQPEVFMQYDGANIINTSPRQVSDFFHNINNSDLKGELNINTTNQEKLKASKNRSDKLLEVLTSILKNTVDEDAYLTVPVQDALKKSSSNDSHMSLEVISKSGSIDVIAWHLDTDMMRIATQTRNLSIFEPKKTSHHDANIMQSIACRTIRYHSLEAKVNETGYHKLAPSTRAIFKLIHDLMTVTNTGTISSEIPYSNFSDVAHTQWDDGVNEPLVIPWSVTQWKSFWHLDIFTKYWNEGLALIQQAQREKAYLKDDDFITLTVINWIYSTVQALIASPDNIDNFDNKFLDIINKNKDDKFCFSKDNAEAITKEIFEKIDSLANHLKNKREAGEDDQEADQIEDKLIELLCFTMPEVGIKKHKGNNSTSKDNLESLLSKIQTLDIFKEKRILNKIHKYRFSRVNHYICTDLGLSFFTESDRTDNGDIAVEKHDEKNKGNKAIFTPKFIQIKNNIKKQMRQGVSADIYEQKEEAKKAIERVEEVEKAKAKAKAKAKKIAEEVEANE